MSTDLRILQPSQGTRLMISSCIEEIVVGNKSSSVGTVSVSFGLNRKVGPLTIAEALRRLAFSLCPRRYTPNLWGLGFGSTQE